MKIFSPSLRHKVQLEEKTQTLDTAGGYENTWKPVAILWASIRRLRGNESFLHGQRTARSSHIFRLRYNRDIKVNQRFTFNGRHFGILTLHVIDEKDRIVDVYVEEGGAE